MSGQPSELQLETKVYVLEKVSLREVCVGQ